MVLDLKYFLTYLLSPALILASAVYRLDI